MKNEHWPEFPLWWLEESRRNMDSLKDIVSHLHDKSSTYMNHPFGVRGETNEIEKQVIEHINVLRQQVGILTDVVQSSLQIVAEDHWRRTHRIERLYESIRSAARKVETKLTQNMFYRILAIVGSLGTLVTIVYFLIHFSHHLKSW
jgi:hypothetical protein